MQFALKGIGLPFAIALKAIGNLFASYRTVFDSRMQYCLTFFGFFFIFLAVANPVYKVQKRI
jgi:hypothetical protein